MQDLCITDDTDVNLEADPDSQYAFNHTGRSCGGCKDGYSVAIGSSNCIHCPINNNLALLVFFAAAGFLLVFFISALNLTVSEGHINGLIFYANIVRVYQNVIFPYRMSSFPKTFIAWLNLDFGIDCGHQRIRQLYKNLAAVYISALHSWNVFISLKYSTKVLKLVGSHSVPTLAPLLFPHVQQTPSHNYCWYESCNLYHLL